LRGFVSWVGRSSMEVTLEVCEQEKPEKKILESFFVMVARNDATGKSGSINPLQTENDPEARWRFVRGEVNKKRRSQESAESLRVVEPNPKEMSLIHKMMMDNKAHHSETSSVLMSSTELQHVTMTQPQDKNTRNKIFGGYLMRRAFELARSTAYLFCGPGSQPFVLAVDDITFLRPVHIGSLIRFTSKVVYCPEPESTSANQTRAFQVLVTSEITDLKTGEIDTSNTFHLTFGISQFGKDRSSIPKVVPQSYSEAMDFLDGKRRFEHSKSVAFISKSALYEFY
jgi:acyl-coenzyme A thioesterase 9